MGMSETIGVIGIGKPVARHLLAAGYEVTVTDIRDPPGETLVSEGATRAESPADLASVCDGSSGTLWRTHRRGSYHQGGG